MVMSEISDKLACLSQLISAYKTVGIAYSGGVDSTTLAVVACRTLGPDNVLLVHGASCLIGERVSQEADTRIKMVVPDVRIRHLTLSVLHEPRIATNDADRCYYCKKIIFQAFQAEIEKENIEQLLDGTNLDDLQQDRPGLRAIRELRVHTPLAEAGLTKADVRALARYLGLPQADTPADSCLATRIAPFTRLSPAVLQLVDTMEAHFRHMGYVGCRLRPRGTTIIVELRAADIGRCAGQDRESIRSYFLSHGFTTVLLDLQPRPAS
jgi:uncharacterized protein